MEDTTPRKYCPGCESWKDATPEYWHKGNSKYGLHGFCKECRSQRKTPLPEPVPEGYKRCPHCEKVKIGDDFYKANHTSDRLDGWCKICHNAQSEASRRKKRGEKREEKQIYMAERPCTRCGEDDPAKFYYPNGKKASICKKCDIEQKKHRQKANPEVYLERQRKWKEANPGYYRKWAYGLSPEEYQAMVEAQFGLCAICGGAPKDGKFHVDHCHTSGVVRGLLCTSCNLMLGLAKDNPEILIKAAKYLKLHST